MAAMRLRDVMTVDVYSARPETPVKEIARLLVSHRISGVPITDGEGHVVGIVTESDLLPVRGRRRSGVVAVARDVMTNPVITLTEGDTVTEAARVLQRHGVKRAPVVREGRLVGLVTRSDLLRPYLRTDLEIQTEIETDLTHPSMGLVPQTVTVTVAAGVVRLTGPVEDERIRSVITRLARTTDGVVDLVDNLEVRPPEQEAAAVR